MLWDAIFADSCPPSLCDQLVVSLLMALRDLLLRYEYADAVQLLMKLPSNLSVHYCTLFALHLKDPLRFPKPTGVFFSIKIQGNIFTLIFFFQDPHSPQVRVKEKLM